MSAAISVDADVTRDDAAGCRVQLEVEVMACAGMSVVSANGTQQHRAIRHAPDAEQVSFGRFF